jgi:hypothetical protein
MANEYGQVRLVSGGSGSVATDDGGSATNAVFDLTGFEKLLTRDVPLSALSAALHLRQSGTNPGHVQLLADAADSSELPPILVQEDGCRVIDGLHRVQAAELRGDHFIKARFLDCTDSEALILALEANSSHGLPLSKPDRVSGAERVVAAHPDWSDRAIAGITGLSAKMIAAIRVRLTGAPHPDGKRLGKDGKRRPISASEGRRRAAEYIRAHPEAPLRQIAREVDVSLGTVHDVSARLRRGDSPERNGCRVSDDRPATQPNGAAENAVPVALSTDGTLVRRKNHNVVPPTWAEVASQIAKDPTVRYSEGGKEFLRWMALHASEPQRWRELVDSIPTHWLSVIALIADSIGKEWSLFAEQLQRSGSGAVGV